MRSNSIRIAVLTFACLFAAAALISPKAACAAEWLTGVGSPTLQLGAEGDLFLNLDSGQIFRKTQGTWVYVGLLRAGALGRGPGWLSGSGSPSAKFGDEEDMYLDIITGRAYKKTSGTWLFLADLKGLEGQKGEKGDRGETGPPGGLPQASACLPGQYVRSIGVTGLVTCAQLPMLPICPSGNTIRSNGTAWVCSGQ